MEADSEDGSHDMSLSFGGAHMRDYAVENLDMLAGCVFCHRALSSENEATGDPEAMRICGDCNFLFLEDLGSPAAPDSPWRPPSRGRGTRHTSSESTENLFSQQFSHIVNVIRQNRASVSGHDGQPVDADATARLLQRTSSRTTPSGSRRWQRVLSDTESDGFDNMDSLYGEIDSNVSLGRYRVFHMDSDTVSFSAYGGESDVSVDGHSFLDTDMFIQPDEETDVDSDTDIDPMHAGSNQWNSEDLEEEEDDDEWEVADAEESGVESTEVGSQAQNLLSSSRDSFGAIIWRGRSRSSEFEGIIRPTIRQGRETYITNIFSNLDESEVLHYHGNSENYLDPTGFGALLDHLAETESSRRGAPPAALSFVNSLPRIVVNEEHHKQDDLICAICKDLLSVNTEGIQLPCFHLYHPFCILPWLSARNSCPLCRYELPTDDKDYEDGKRNHSSGMDFHEIEQQDTSDDSSSDAPDRAEADEAQEMLHGRIERRRGLLDEDPAVNSSGREGGRGRWFFNSAAPILSLVGIVLVMWLGNPLMERRGPVGPRNICEQSQNHIRNSGLPLPNQRESRRRWWFPF